mmetsp:Transcript_44506/g.83459  ORF Transcript_44506/g.83459 Transcript_44506/m.83459 type:complete len:396 (+) Transcript_44506:71-1258(+)
MFSCVFLLICLACASHGHRTQTVQGTSKANCCSSQNIIDSISLSALAGLLQAFEPSSGWQVTGTGHRIGTAHRGTRAPAPHAFFGLGKRVVVAGACSQTGQFVARYLSDSFRVTALCRSQIGERVKDDTGTLAQAKVGFVDGTSVDADALVIATDDAPSAESMSTFVKSCSDAGVPHIVLLSRIGASRGGFGPVGEWKKAEEAALQTFGEKGLTIVRVGDPVTGGPFFEKEVDTIKWSAAKAVDGYRTLSVQSGDDARQQGLGSPRAAAAQAISSVLRRGPEEMATFSVTGDTTKASMEETTQSQLDAMFEEAGGKASSPGGSFSLTVDLEDNTLRPFTSRSLPKPPSLQDLLFAPPAVSGGYWGAILMFIYGGYLTTTPEYVAKTGVNPWGIQI